MSAEVQKQPKSEVIPPRGIVALRFIDSVPFGGTESTYVDLTRGVRVYAARIEPDGSAVAITSGQRSDGLVLEREWIDRTDNKKRTERVLVQWANVRCVIY